ncbi:hypothetical protein [uncultured Methanolobus sp.]|uniref:helix-turn-helix transcriptional regulator n=1 Tax=uncultured Methanolobus sp. TaxID=218300 RepID=UPI0029C74CDA|nr:hypothetical protein [uncultured Methanolobus sp.]
MKKPLIEVIFASEKRKQVLWLLKDGAKDMKTLLKDLDATRTALLPQIRILEEHYLVSHDNYIYELTTIGKLVVNDMAPLLNIVETFDTDIDYWGTHNLDFIPVHLLTKMNILKEYQIINPPLTDQFDIKCIYNENSKNPSFSIQLLQFFTLTIMLYSLI